jgi:ActR/RegA family two-component response regulator
MREQPLPDYLAAHENVTDAADRIATFTLLDMRLGDDASSAIVAEVADCRPDAVVGLLEDRAVVGSRHGSLDD